MHILENDIFKGLNEHQREAVSVTEGPLLILAGAGSGKTKCLTHRICHLIEKGLRPERILAVTFTNKAAGEMKSRMEKLLSGRTDFFSYPTIGTFHSVCAQILRKHIEYLNIGITNQFVIFDTNDTGSLMRHLMKDLDIDDKSIKYKAVLSFISSAKNQLLSPAEFANKIDYSPFTDAVKILFPAYQQKLQEHNALDFDDLLQKTVQLFEQSAHAREYYQNRWDHVLIDEYQDTNLAQYQIARILSERHGNICAIGDDHQSIYSFRGADYRNILNFEKDFKGSRVIKLEQNYRSTSNILKAANSLIANNRTGRKKTLWTENENGDPVSLSQVLNEREEGDFIAHQIKELVQSHDFSYRDCSILYRMNAQSRALEESLMRHQIPYQIVGGMKFFERAEIKDMVAYIRLIFNPRDDVAFLRIINVPSRKIGVATLEILQRYGRSYTKSLLESIDTIDEVLEISDTKREALKQVAKLFHQWRDLLTDNICISKLLEQIIQGIGYEEYLHDGSEEGKSKIQNVKELLSVAVNYDTAENSVASFLEGMSLLSDLDRYEDQENRVTLMTMHLSKGLEFPVVFLPGWEETIFPSSNAVNEGNIEEERRLAYVAITRARKKCFILNAHHRMLFGRSDYSEPSRFLQELDSSATHKAIEDYTHKRTFSPKDKIFASHSFVPKNKTEAIFGIAENKSGYAIGNRVLHSDFGKGTIVLISGDVLSVAFEGKGIKKLLASIAPLEKMEA